MGYEEARFLEHPGEEFKCQVCKLILENPVECSLCQDSFCQSCIDLRLNTNSTCPRGCQLKLQPCHRQFKNIYLRLKIRCIRTAQGCQEVLTLEHLQKHEAKDCAYRQEVCKYEGCGARELAGEMSAHEESCGWQRIRCEKCGFSYCRKDGSEHNCLKTLVAAIEEVNKANTVLEGRITRIEEDDEESVITKSIAQANLQIHIGVTCSGCQQSPIQGKRFTCLLCPSYDLCEVCRESVKHTHDSFEAISSSESHEGVRCDGCSARPIRGLRYKCRLCPDFDYCHQCRVSQAHPHADFVVWQPFWVTIVPLPVLQKYYKAGETLHRSWLLVNLGSEVIQDLVLNCVGGEPGCRHTSFHYDIRVDRNQSSLLQVSEPVLDSLASGDYSSEWVMSTLERGSFFGPKLSYCFSVI